MQCIRCKEVKPEEDMYRSNTYLSPKYCNKCSRYETESKILFRNKKRKKFVEKFNKMEWENGLPETQE